jgi:hypothetical protein
VRPDGQSVEVSALGRERSSASRRNADIGRIVASTFQQAKVFPMQDTATTQESNKELVRAGFERWVRASIWDRRARASDSY